MLVTVSPAKRLDWTDRPGSETTTPQFAKDAVDLAAIARGLSAGQLQKLMSISANLAKLNHERFQTFSAAPAPEATRPAIFAFAGDTYQGLDAASLDEDALRYAQDHLGILSGLYGLLRPFDRIQAYRLEMGSRLQNRKGPNLYAYWGDRIAKALNAQARATGARALINCASVEYFSAVDTRALELPVIHPVFLEEKNGEARIVSFYAKKARGAMARFILENRLRDPDALSAFSTGGYRFDPARSTPEKPVFLCAEACRNAA